MLANENLHEMDKIAKDLKVDRTEYLRRAILAMNRKVHEDSRRNRIMALSNRVRKESMRINAEFSEVEHDPEY